MAKGLLLPSQANRANRRRSHARSTCSILALAAAGALLLPEVAAAADAVAAPRTATLEELVVTAGKREQSLQDVPVSVEVVEGQKIKDLSLQNLDDLSQHVPGLSVVEGGEQTGISIRGFGSGLNFGFETSVGLFIDEIYAGRERQFRSTFLDIASIEVLKGPQGTLFGKNTIAGAIIISTAQPTQDPSLSLHGEYTPETERRVFEAVANGPITDTLAGRLAVRWSKDNGYLFNTLTREDEEREEDKIIRGSLLWEPTDRLTVRTKLEYSEYDRSGRAYQVSRLSGIAVGRPFTTNPTTLQPLTVPADVPLQSRLSTYRVYDPNFDFGLDGTTSKQASSAHVEAKNAVVDISYDLGPATLRSITGYSAYDSNDQREVDFSPTTLLFEPITQAFDQWSQELRIVSDVGERFDYVAGVYWFKTDFFVDRRTDVDLAPLLAPGLDLAALKFSQLRFLDQTAETYSAYAQGTWHIVPDTVHLSVGGRWVHEEKKARDRLDFAEFGTTRFLDPVNVPGDAALLASARALSPGLDTIKHAASGKLTEENFSPEIKLSWDVNEDLMLYAGATKGFKGGGFNSNFGNPANLAEFTFDAEKATSYEVGGKLRLLDRAMELNVAVFRQNFRDLQLSIYDGAQSGFVLTNAGGARSQGFEANVRWQATERLQVTGAVSLLDTEYTETLLFPCSIPQLNFGAPGCFLISAPTTANPAAMRPVQDFNGRRFAPSYTGSLGAQYVQPLTDDLELLLRADATFKGRSALPIDVTLQQPPLELLDLSATLRPVKGGPWRLGVLVQNATKEKYYLYEFDAPLQNGTVIGIPAAPRRVTFRVDYEF